MSKINPIQLQKHLKGLDYPAKKQTLIKHAKQNKADDNMISVLEKLPEREYKTPADVNKAIGAIK